MGFYNETLLCVFLNVVQRHKDIFIRVCLQDAKFTVNLFSQM